MTILASGPSGNAVPFGLADGDTFLNVGDAGVTDQQLFEVPLPLLHRVRLQNGARGSGRSGSKGKGR